MDDIRPIQSFDQIKTLSDPRRMAILRRLMSGPATLTHLGNSLGEHPAWIRHHLKRLEEAGLVELASVKVTSGVVEKFYRATARLFILQQTILPELEGEEPLILLGSHDLALSLLSERLFERLHMDLLTLPTGSLDGLIALRQGIAHLSACHLLDRDSGEYNLPTVRHLFPERPMRLVTLAHREQGLLLAHGNPHGVRGLEDLVRGDLTFINRNPGSGTRLWLDQQLARIGIAPEGIRGYTQEVRTPTGVALAVAGGSADAGVGLAAAARKLKLDFIPLFQERFDLVIPADVSQTRKLEEMLGYLNSGEFRQSAEGLGGYSTLHTGEEIRS
jgi:putative molybdopterin biosynthesis protein